MLTQCPECQSIFKIDNASLKVAEGIVECGECSSHFDAIAQQIHTKQESVDTKPVNDNDEGYYQIHNATSVIQQKKSSSPLWLIGVILLSLTAISQYLLIQRDAFSQKPFLRPILEPLCKIKGCTLPYISNISAFELLEHMIESHPEYPGGLLITGTLRNNAAFTQSFPLLELQMNDIEQKPIASRRFKAREYLPSGMSTDAIEAMTEVPILLEIVDPGDNAVGFKFSFFSS